jgi:hypothetical protein
MPVICNGSCLVSMNEPHAILKGQGNGKDSRIVTNSIGLATLVGPGPPSVHPDWAGRSLALHSMVWIHRGQSKARKPQASSRRSLLVSNYSVRHASEQPAGAVVQKPHLAERNDEISFTNLMLSNHLLYFRSDSFERWMIGNHHPSLTNSSALLVQPL